VRTTPPVHGTRRSPESSSARCRLAALDAARHASLAEGQLLDIPLFAAAGWLGVLYLAERGWGRARGVVVAVAGALIVIAAHVAHGMFGLPVHFEAAGTDALALGAGAWAAYRWLPAASQQRNLFGILGGVARSGVFMEAVPKVSLVCRPPMRWLNSRRAAVIVCMMLSFGAAACKDGTVLAPAADRPSLGQIDPGEICASEPSTEGCDEYEELEQIGICPLTSIWTWGMWDGEGFAGWATRAGGVPWDYTTYDIVASDDNAVPIYGLAWVSVGECALMVLGFVSTIGSYQMWY
jgi:hypothetical protein